ncbi:VOC family protein [Taibaiella koreensis]|uniref:VOC family protein n=1 Tax=Taibaiella koreensis TaxID=1268548 RepID=UPI000E59B4F2|nr:VOC family protein [Taibaiella koreensis]
MTPKMIWANLTVSDLDRTTRFYTQLGFRSNGSSKDLTSFFFGENNLIIHFFLKEVLQTNMKIEIADAQKASEVMFSLSTDSREQVDSWAKEVEAAGGQIISPPEAFGGSFYGFTFADPDGHKFNVLLM